MGWSKHDLGSPGWHDKSGGQPPTRTPTTQGHSRCTPRLWNLGIHQLDQTLST